MSPLLPALPNAATAGTVRTRRHEPSLPSPPTTPSPNAEPLLPDTAESDQIFATAADLFRLLATPMRLKIISALCGQEKNVSQLLAEIHTTQPNMSQHLAALHRAGVVARRREATQVYYRIGSERAAGICRAVCMQIAMEMDGDAPVPAGERLTPLVR